MTEYAKEGYLPDERNQSYLGCNMARFLRLRGWNVVTAAGVHWVDSGTGRRWLMAVPDYAMPTPRAGELGTLLRETRMLALRYPSKREAGIAGGLYVCRDKGYSLGRLQSRCGQAVRKCLRCCDIREVGVEELLTQGLECNRETMRRQGRKNREFDEPRRWRRFVEAALQIPAIKIAGAFVEGELAAYMLGCLDDGWWNLLYSFSRTHLRQYYPNHGLMYSMIEGHIRRPEVHTVCSGPRTLLTEDGLHTFKTRIGFELEPHDVVVRLHPALEPFAAGGATTGVLRVIRKAWPASVRLARMEAFLRSAQGARRLSGPGDPVRPELGANTND